MIGRRSPEKSVTKVRLAEAAAQLFARQGFKAVSPEYGDRLATPETLL
jgi:AcrR family transcriptional regulator